MTATRQPDILLHYMSALRSGSWQSFKAAVPLATQSHQEDQPPWLPSVLAENLSALGHIEFAFDTDLSWTVSPAVLAGRTGAGHAAAALCGNRTSVVMDGLRQAADRFGVKFLTSEQDRAPSAVIVECGAEGQLEQLASSVGVEYLPRAGWRLARCLPTLASYLRAAPAVPVPSGFPAYRFDEVALEWQPVEAVDRAGSYRFDTYRPEHRVIARNVAKKVSRSIAVYHALALAHARVLEYDSDRGELILPPEARPPVLYARALVLCSGQVPVWDSARRRLSYRDIPADVALAVMRGLEGSERNDE